jgi:hypothetical protein
VIRNVWQRWRAAGLPNEQAEQMVALSQEMEQGVATKEDVLDLQAELAIAVRDLKVWTGGVGVALFSALAVIRFFG